MVAKPAKNWLEWSVFAVGLVIVAVALPALVKRRPLRDDAP